MSACSSQQYSQNVIINSEDALVKKEAELFFFDTNLVMRRMRRSLPYSVTETLGKMPKILL